VSASPGCTNSAGTVTCTVATLASGASATFSINATAPATAGPITNTATVKGNEPDPNTANNTASATTTIVASADLSITKTAPVTATTSSPITYSVTATNNGPSPATGVVVTATLPAGVTFVSATSSQGTCTNASGTVTCSVGNLASGASATLTINGTAPATPG